MGVAPVGNRRGLPRFGRAVVFVVATGCGMRTPLNPSAGAGGGPLAAAIAGQVAGGAGTSEVAVGSSGTGGGGNSGDFLGSGGSGGRGGTPSAGGTTEVGGGVVQSGGTVGSEGGMFGSGGSSHTGGVGGLAGMLGTGGVVPSGGTPASGGTGGAASTARSGSSCTTNADCPSGSTCCDGSSESCDGTRLPSGDATDSGEFVVSSDGLTVTDTITGLVWQMEGWSARAGCNTDSTQLTCTLAEGKAYCSGLSLSGFSDWRLPAVHEFDTLVDLAQADPAIDMALFPYPNTASLDYWTSSPSATSSGNAWELDFDFGYSIEDAVGRLRGVRCVRGARCYPASRFVGSNGFVTDKLTGLVWQLLASSKDMTWSDAKSYCSTVGSGFRLPALKELESLVDLTVTSSPTINQTAFPNTQVDMYWTSSQLAGRPDSRWIVSFGDGSSGSASVGVGQYAEVARVRCVR